MGLCTAGIPKDARVSRPTYKLPVSLSQHQTPLLDALWQCSQRPHAPFYTPGHKQGSGISSRQRRVFGSDIFRLDLPELPELDNLMAPDGAILAAQQLAAGAFGAEASWFLANGSTCGIEAALLALCGPGDKVIVPRNVHQSVVSGLILSGAHPVWLAPAYAEQWQLPLGLRAQQVANALEHHPDARAVLIVSPTYEGVCSDVAAIAELAHSYDIPLIVDEAHGPHLGFHPDLPDSALASGADVVIQSVHKLLSAFTQAALLHCQGQRCDRSRLSQALRMTQSSSPSYLLLASLDAARHQMATQGEALMTRTLALAQQAREQLALPVLNVSQTCQGFSQDLTRLTVDVTEKGTGYAVDSWLHRQGVTAELPSLRHLTFIVSLGNTARHIEQLVAAMQQLPFQGPVPTIPPVPWADLMLPEIAPRQTFFAATARLPLARAAGRLSAATVCPYPPGIPTIMPGEPVSQSMVDHLLAARAAGAELVGLSGPDTDIEVIA